MYDVRIVDRDEFQGGSQIGAYKVLYGPEPKTRFGVY